MAMSRSRGGTWLTTRSPILIAPSLISSRPATMRRAVVLPHPEGPTRTMNSSSAISRSIFETARVPSGYTLATSLNVTPATRPPQVKGQTSLRRYPLRLTLEPDRRAAAEASDPDPGARALVEPRDADADRRRKRPGRLLQRGCGSRARRPVLPDGRSVDRRSGGELLSQDERGRASGAEGSTRENRARRAPSGPSAPVGHEPGRSRPGDLGHGLPSLRARGRVRRHRRHLLAGV